MTEYAVVIKESETSLQQRVEIITSDYAVAVDYHQRAVKCGRFAQIYKREVGAWQDVDITKKQDK